MKSFLLFLLALLSIPIFTNQNGLLAQVRPAVVSNRNVIHPIEEDSIYAVADASFRKHQKRWLLGDHYRKEWIIPVKVPVIQLEVLEGGLVAMKQGGGMQTRSLHLESDRAKSKNYVIRSVEKFPDRALPEELRGTIASSFVKDQISSAHPYAPLVASALAEAAGIYHTNPQLGFVPHSTLLGAYDSLYGNQLYLLEERPSGDWSNAPFFGYSKDVMSTGKMRKLLLSGPQFKVDQVAFLRARLLDILIGDWDRHEDQWAWASFTQDEQTVFRPIPKDRDQAFARLDGVIPWVSTRKWAYRRTQNFDYTISDLLGLVWSGRNVDREFLPDLEWKDWEREARSLQNSWSVSTIDAAVRRLPDTLYVISGIEIAQKLKRRRDDLLKYAKQYYESLAREIDWVGTNKNDQFVISLTSDSSVQIFQHHVTDEGAYVEVRNRTFKSNETREIRLYSVGGNDRFEVWNDFKLPIRIRVISASGVNQYIDNREYRFGKKPLLYDPFLKHGQLPQSLGVRRSYDSVTHTFRINHRYNQVIPVVLPGFNPDDGIFLGGGVRYTKHKWGHSPFNQQHFMAANYAFLTGAYNFLYKGVFSKLVGKWDLVIQGKLNQPNYVLNYYGLGNNTEMETKNRAFYRIRVRQAGLTGGIQRAFGNKHALMLAGEVISSRTESWGSRFVSSTNIKIDSADFTRTTWFGGTVGYSYNSSNHTSFPTKGWIWRNELRYHAAAAGSRSFLSMETSLGSFVSLGNAVFASRLGGGTLWGDPQFFQYHQLGGLTNLRGYRRSRFTGKSFLYHNNELRIPLTDLHTYLVNGKLGFTVFGDYGRVWVDDEYSKRWHAGYGAGLWIIPFDRMAFSVNFSRSKEGSVFFAKAGLFF